MILLTSRWRAGRLSLEVDQRYHELETDEKMARLEAIRKQLDNLAERLQTANLSPYEHAAFRSALLGKSVREIARELQRSESMVRTLLQRARMKLHLAGNVLAEA